MPKKIGSRFFRISLIFLLIEFFESSNRGQTADVWILLKTLIGIRFAKVLVGLLRWYLTAGECWAIHCSVNYWAQLKVKSEREGHDT